MFVNAGIQEFASTITALDAEYGRGSMALIIYTPKSMQAVHSNETLKQEEFLPKIDMLLSGSLYTKIGNRKNQVGIRILCVDKMTFSKLK